MADGYTKVFRSMMKSSVWSNTPKYVKVMWITLLASIDQNGEVKAGIPGIAKEAELSMAEAEKAIEFLSSPDPHSANKAYEGRRILRIEDGWWVVSHRKYRDLMSKEDRLEKDAARKRRERAAVKKEEK